MTEVKLNLAPTIQGATSAPLTDARQLVPGSFVASRGTAKAWEVIEVVGEKVLLKAAGTAPVPSDHSHAWTSMQSFAQNRNCACGMREQVIEGDHGLLPLRPESPRVSVFHITAGRRLVTPRPFVVYMGTREAGHVQGGAWKATDGSGDRAIPIFPVMMEVWELPEELRQ